MGDIQKLSPENFPGLLNEMPDPPRSLFLKGALPDASLKFLTVVGSRRMSSYAKDACEFLISRLAGYPVVIVSGLALGVDGVAHKSALKAGLTTVAFPGSGLDESVLYPRAHVALSKEIIGNGGALISEMEPMEPATTYSFPKRNRLMAAVSHATLVVEATVKSGTLITAKLATDYNRELLILPHSIFSSGGAGGHIFMKLGARPVRTAGDILDALGIAQNETELTLSLTSEERATLNALTEPKSRDELIQELNLNASEANVLLARMELRGLITESMGLVRKLVDH